MLNFYEYHNVQLDNHYMYGELVDMFLNNVDNLKHLDRLRNECEMYETKYKPIEHIIKKDGRCAILWAAHVTNERWLEAEPYIMQDTTRIYYYAKQVIGGRWIDAEPRIIDNAFLCYWYAKDIVKGKWVEAEPTILKDWYYWIKYQGYMDNFERKKLKINRFFK